MRTICLTLLFAPLFVSCISGNTLPEHVDILSADTTAFSPEVLAFLEIQYSVCTGKTSLEDHFQTALTSYRRFDTRNSHPGILDANVEHAYACSEYSIGDEYSTDRMEYFYHTHYAALKLYTLDAEFSGAKAAFCQASVRRWTREYSAAAYASQRRLPDEIRRYRSEYEERKCFTQNDNSELCEKWREKPGEIVYDTYQTIDIELFFPTTQKTHIWSLYKRPGLLNEEAWNWEIFRVNKNYCFPYYGNYVQQLLAKDPSARYLNRNQIFKFEWLPDQLKTGDDLLKLSNGYHLGDDYHDPDIKTRWRGVKYL